MFRRIWSIPMMALIFLLLLAACGQSNDAPPATATSAANAPTTTTVAGAVRRTATAAPRQATATTAAQPPPSAATSKGDPKSIVVAKPVPIVATTVRTVVAVAVRNTGDRYATFTLKPKQRSSTKAVLGTQTTVTAMPAGATWTVTLIADEFQARDYDLFDVQVDEKSYFVVPQTIDPSVAQRIKLTEPVVTIEGKQARATVETTNENDKRVSFRLHVFLVKDGVITGATSWDVTLEPGKSQKHPLIVDGSTEGAVPRTQISNIGGL